MNTPCRKDLLNWSIDRIDKDSRPKACWTGGRHGHAASGGGRARKRTAERGGVLLVVVISLVVIIGMAALTMDLGVLYVAARQAQNTADAAALAGAGKLREGLNPTAANQAALQTAAQNAVLNSSVTLLTSDVKVGAWDKANQRVADWDPTAKAVAVQVTVRRTQGAPDGPVPSFFSRIWGRNYLETSRTAIASLNIESRPRNPVHVMIVQDASSSFEDAWDSAINADIELFSLINRVSVRNDALGFVAFNSSLPQSYLERAGLWQAYRLYPDINRGIKYTTDSNGRPVKTDSAGAPSFSGQVRRMSSDITGLDPRAHDQLPTALDTATRLLRAGSAWGDTDTAAGLNFAIDSLQSYGGSAEKVIVLVSDGMPHSVEGSYQTSLLKQAAVNAANRAAAAGIRIHTVTLEGTEGVNFEFNESLIRNGGYALRASNAGQLRDMLISVGTLEVGQAYLVK